MKKIQVLGQTIEVHFDNSQLKKDELGLFDSTSMRIFMREELRKHALRHSVLLHEVTHAILCISGQSQIISHEQEEALCMALEYGLRPFFSLRLL
jgi:hypothetical protein